MFTRSSLTFAIFEPADRADAQEVARRLSSRSHFVSIHEGDEFVARKLPMRATAIERSVFGGVLILGSIVLAALAATELMGHQLAGGSLGLPHVLAALAVALFFGGLIGLLNGAITAAPELARAEEALGEPGRFALTVTTGRARRGFVEAELARAGAVTVGSI